MSDRTLAGESLEHLPTEAAGAGGDHDLRPTRELVLAMNAEDATVPRAVEAAAGAIADAIDEIAARLAAGGRLVYIGAGSSGLVAALDAAELEATFSTEPGRVVAIVAGAGTVTAADRDAAEDDPDAGERAVADAGASGKDAVVVVSASGRTPFAVGAARAAAAAGSLTVALVSVEGSELAAIADREIAVPTGPEFIAGSTRLKAATAQKLVLNTISTVTMIRLGQTFGNLMVGVTPTNEKLRARLGRVVETATGATPEAAEAALDDADGDAKVAIVALRQSLDATAARARLEAADGDLRRALER
jgi:N-acetylmuramic acid 6-phosphate etherase